VNQERIPIPSNRDALWWSDSNIRIPLRHALLRMLESKDRNTYDLLVEIWI